MHLFAYAFTKKGFFKHLFQAIIIRTRQNFEKQN